MDALLCAPGQADEALGMLQNRLQAHPSLAQRPPLARVCVGRRDDPAEVPPARSILHEQRQVAGALHFSMSPLGFLPPLVLGPPPTRGAHVHVDLRPVNRPRGRTPREPIASSIEPDTELWSVSASAS